MDPLREYIHLTRREFLTSAAGGIGGLALASLLANNVLADNSNSGKPNPLTAKTPHYAPKAKNCIFFFFSGGSSQVDLFDPKPKLNELQGQPLPESALKGVRLFWKRTDLPSLEELEPVLDQGGPLAFRPLGITKEQADSLVRELL